MAVPASFSDLRPTRPVAVAVVVFALVYLALDLNKLYALRYGADTGTFLQFLTGEAHGRGSWNAAEARPHLQVHDSWALLALVPLLAAFPYAQTLLVVQVLAVALAAFPIALFARSCGATKHGAFAVAVAYLLSPSAQGLAFGNFLENVFVPVIAGAGALAARRRAPVATLVCAQLLLGLKEDEALFLIWFGGACALWWDRRIGIALVLLAAVNGAAFVLVERLAHAAPSVPGYTLHVDHPLGKLSFFAALLAPFAFAPLALGPTVFLALPLVAELTFNRPWAYEVARIGTHWTAPIVAATALGAALAVARYPRLATPMLLCALLCALTINDTDLKIGRWPYIVDWNVYAAAMRLRSAETDVVVPQVRDGIYAVAAVNPHVLLQPFAPGLTGWCPSYNTDAAAWLAAMGLRSWPPETTLCAGVAVPSGRQAASPPPVKERRHAM